jgi:hypothetical protein
MNDLNNIRKFEYRPCRIPTGIELKFDVEGETLRGLCKDVSNEGVRATLDGSVAVGSAGLLVLRHPAGVLEIEAQVAYIEDCHVGLAFVLRTSWERGMTNDFIASIADHGGSAPILPFP